MKSRSIENALHSITLNIKRAPKVQLLIVHKMDEGSTELKEERKRKTGNFLGTISSVMNNALRVIPQWTISANLDVT